VRARAARRPALTPRSSALKRALFRVFLALERVGVHVLPRHFYSSIADRGWLARNPELWRRPFSVPAVETDLDGQIAWLQKCCSPYLEEVSGFSFLPRLEALGISFRYGLIEAQVLHCVVRTHAPPRVVEVGGGASTALIADAVARNVAEDRAETQILTIDPYPSPALARLPRVTLLAEPAQTASGAVFEALSAGDLLFIDSTHVVKTGSELSRLYLEVLPSLPPGVIVHIHDIYLPYLSSPWVLSDFWDWQESTLLAALLVDNARLEVLCCQSALHTAAPDRLRVVLPDYRPLPLDGGIDTLAATGHFPSSVWLRSR
jgi:hypothetical protein